MIVRLLVGVEASGRRGDGQVHLRLALRLDCDGLFLRAAEVWMPDHHLVRAGRNVADFEPVFLIRRCIVGILSISRPGSAEDCSD
jgi:hypothetical protein